MKQLGTSMAYSVYIFLAIFWFSLSILSSSYLRALKCKVLVLYSSWAYDYDFYSGSIGFSLAAPEAEKLVFFELISTNFFSNF